MDETLTFVADSGAADEAPPAVPRRVGRLEVGRLLGQGGMGEVYAAYDPHLERSVAVKFLGRATPDDVRRFVREARAQAAQDHPDVCPVYEAGETDDGVPYIVMKRIDGMSLDEATAGWPLERKLGIVRRIARAVHSAHRTGLVHRDLKPGNILVEQVEGEAKPFVLDFGLAFSPTDGGIARDGEMIGTPSYMAPEQARADRRAIDRRTDVYSLGVTLYHLLAGEPPFARCESLETLAQAILTVEPPPLRRLGVPADVEAVVFKCLEKEPSRRYRSARALAEDLQRYLDDVPVLARPQSRGVPASQVG